MKQSRDRLIGQLAETPTEDGELLLAVVFDSVAEGGAAPNSDIDVAVLGRRPLSAARRQALIAGIARATGRSVDLVDLCTASALVTREALNKGQRLFCNDEREYLQLLSRMVMDAEDFLPYRRRALTERPNAWIR